MPRALTSLSVRQRGRRAAAVLALMAALFGANTARADDLDQRVAELLVWVGQETGYEVGDIEATVRFAGPKILNIVGHGMRYSGQADIAAVAIDRTILLPDWFELGRDDALLVHELTHVLQNVNRAQFGCDAEKEREAYETQARFTEETGIGETPSLWFRLFLRCDPNPWKADLRR
jgi:hypothetical protein